MLDLVLLSQRLRARRISFALEEGQLFLVLLVHVRERGLVGVQG
jgi:hypothetical protein